MIQERTYDCVSNFTDVKEHPCQNYHWEWERGIGESWWGVPTTDDVIRIVEHGWPEGLEKARKALSTVQFPRLKNVRRRRARASFGDDLDMQRVYSGDLDRAWGTTKREIGLNQTHQRVVLVCNLSTSAKVTSSQYFWRGAATTVLADALINSGRSIKIVTFMWSRSAYQNGDSSQFVITVKDYDEPMLPEKVIAVLGLAGFFRYYGFKEILSSKDKADTGLGVPVQGRTPEILKREYPCEFITIENIWNKEDTQVTMNYLEQRLIKS